MNNWNPSEKGEYCIFAKLIKVNFEKNGIPLKTGNTVVNQKISDSVTQWLIDSVTHWLSDSGVFFLIKTKYHFCLGVIIVPSVITFFFSFLSIKQKYLYIELPFLSIKQKYIYIELSFKWNFTNRQNVHNSVKLCELLKKESNMNILQGLLTFFVCKLVGEGPRGPVFWFQNFQKKKLKGYYQVSRVASIFRIF